jgi:hypothetical protein
VHKIPLYHVDISKDGDRLKAFEATVRLFMVSSVSAKRISGVTFRCDAMTCPRAPCAASLRPNPCEHTHPIRFQATRSRWSSSPTLSLTRPRPPADRIAANSIRSALLRTPSGFENATDLTKRCRLARLQITRRYHAMDAREGLPLFQRWR